MAALNSKLLKDTQDLVRFYNTNPSFRELFNQLLPLKRVRYQGRPLKFYVKFLTSFSPRYKPYYNRFLGSNEVASELLTTYYQDPREYNKLQQSVRQSVLGQEILIWGKEDHQQLEQIDFISDQAKKESAFEAFLNKKDAEEGAKPEIITPISQISPITQPTTSALKNLSSKSQILFKKLTTEYSSQLITIGSGGLGAIFGGVVLGPPGALAGATGGFLAPSFLKNGGGELVLKGGVRTVEAGSRAFSSLGTLTNIFPAKWIIIGIFLALFILPIFLGLLKSSAPFAPIDIAESAPIESPGGGGGGGGDIAQCKFQRGDRTPQSESFQSSVLLGYFQEVAQKTSVPASLLAAVARVETPGSTIWTNAQAQSGSICPISGDIATGLMQIIPPWSHRTDAYCKECVDQGASYFGKTAAQLIPSDFCDPRKSIYIGAGFILKKLQLGYRLGNGTQWDPAWTNNQTVIYNVARSFYGALEYGARPFNYGEDIWTSVQSCKSTAPIISPPVGDLRLAIKQNFNLDFQDTSLASPGVRFTDKELGWAWEALSEARSKSLRFFMFINDVALTRSNKSVLVMHSPSSAETFNGEDPIRVNIRDSGGGPFADKNLFKQILIHELAHIVHGPSGGARDPRYDSGLRQAQIDDQKKLTCYSDVNIDESFSEFSSYYLLNSLPSEQPTSNCALFWPSIHPLQTNLYSNHIKFGAQIY